MFLRDITQACVSLILDLLFNKGAVVYNKKRIIKCDFKNASYVSSYRETLEQKKWKLLLISIKILQIAIQVQTSLQLECDEH